MFKQGTIQQETDNQCLHTLNTLQMPSLCRFEHTRKKLAQYLGYKTTHTNVILRK